MIRAIGRISAALVLTLSFSLWQASPASAHTELASTTPTKGSTVQSPTTVDLTFTGRIQKGLSDIKVTNTTTGTRTDTGPTSNPTDRSMSIALAGVTSGAYTVEWSMVALDGHRQTGTFDFTAEVPATATTTMSAPWDETTGSTGGETVAAQTAAQSSDSGSQTLVLAGAGVVAMISLVVAFLAFRPRY